MSRRWRDNQAEEDGWGKGSKLGDAPWHGLGPLLFLVAHMHPPTTTTPRPPPNPHPTSPQTARRRLPPFPPSGSSPHHAFGQRLPSPPHPGQYATVLLPLVTALLVVPLQDYRGVPTFLKDLHALGLVSRRFATEKLVFSRGEWRKGNRWRALGYAFSHQDLSHLANNLLGLCWTGSTLYRHTGSAFDLYAVFFSSAGASAYLSTHYDELRVRATLSRLVPRNPFSPSSARWFHGPYNHVAQRVTGWTAHFLSHYVQYRGASSGVFGLLGATSMAGLVRSFWTHGHWGSLVVQSLAIGTWCACMGYKDGRLSPLIHLLHFVQAVGCSSANTSCFAPPTTTWPTTSI